MQLGCLHILRGTELAHEIGLEWLSACQISPTERPTGVRTSPSLSNKDVNRRFSSVDVSNMEIDHAGTTHLQGKAGLDTAANGDPHTRGAKLGRVEVAPWDTVSLEQGWMETGIPERNRNIIASGVD